MCLTDKGSRIKVFWDVMQCHWINVSGFHFQGLRETSRMPGVGDKQNARCGRQAECQVWETGRMPGVGDRQKCDCLSVQLLKTICRKFSEPVEEDVVMAIIKCTLTGLDTDW